MEWIISYPSMIFGCAGLSVCVIGLLIETFTRDKPQHLYTELKRKRAKEKAAHRAATRKNGKRLDKTPVHIVARQKSGVNHERVV